MYMQNVYVLIPAYNATKTIIPLVRALISSCNKHNLKCKILVVNDGSTDNTERKLRYLKKHFRKNFDFISYNQNKGVMNATLSGLEHVLRFAKKDDIIVRMDSDYEHNPKDMYKVLRPVLSSEAIMCFGYLEPDIRQGFLFTFLNYFIGGLENKQLFGRWIPQFCPGFYAIRAGVLYNEFMRLRYLCNKYKKRYGSETVHIDMLLALMSKKYGNVKFVKISPIKKQWITQKPFSKTKRYFQLHFNFISFVQDFKILHT
ncbi:MAG: glycosyltransferase family 2 protein [Candidatus Micrarchaeia archaeon]